MSDFQYSPDKFIDIKSLLEYAKKGNYISHDKSQSPLVTNLINEAISFKYIRPSGNSYIISEKGYLLLEDSHKILQTPNPKKKLIRSINIKSLLQYVAWIIGICAGVIAIFKFINNMS